MRKNIVTATGLTGIYKDKNIVVHIGETGRKSKVFVNGIQLKNVQGVWIKILIDEPTKLTMELKGPDKCVDL